MARRNAGTVSIDIPEISRVAAAICRQQGYGPRGEDDALGFLNAYLARHLARLVLDAEAQAAASLAMGDVYSRADDPLVAIVAADPAAAPAPREGGAR